MDRTWAKSRVLSRSLLIGKIWRTRRCWFVLLTCQSQVISVHAAVYDGVGGKSYQGGGHCFGDVSALTGDGSWADETFE